MRKPSTAQLIAEADPLALGAVIEIDTTGPVSDEDVLVLVDRVRAASGTGGDAVPAGEEHRSRT